MKKVLQISVFLLFTTIILCSCVATEKGIQVTQNPQNLATNMTKVPATKVIEATDLGVQITPTSFQNNLESSLAESTPTGMIPTETSTPKSIDVVPNEVEYKCNASNSEFELQKNGNLNGIIVDTKSDAMLLINGEGNELIPTPINNISVTDISPDGKQLAFLISEDSILGWSVTNLLGEQISSYFFEDIQIDQYSWVRWLNDSEIVLPLENNLENYEWIIWSPRENKERRISSVLDGIGEEVIRYGVAPALDPMGELVIYPCERCDGFEYMVKEIESGDNLWSIDIGEKPTGAYRGYPVWSPDGSHIAITGGRSARQNGLWIFDRNGRLVHDIILPDASRAYTADNLFWSPDSQILAFLRLSSDSQGESKQTLAYLSIKTGEVVDFCLNYQRGSGAWSPDSTMIVFLSQENEKPQTLQIIDIEGNVKVLSIKDATDVIGWVNLNNE